MTIETQDTPEGREAAFNAAMAEGDAGTGLQDRTAPAADVVAGGRAQAVERAA